MTKKEIKNIEMIARKLPEVYEQTVSGKEEDGSPHLVNHAVNHKRRMIRAYERLGMEGIAQYLDTIKLIQQKRSARFRDAQGADIHSSPEEGTTVSDDSGVYGTPDLKEDQSL